ncbi:MAG: hypothetical protein ACQET7_09185 [Thermodesulfobacteriota bacterium]
MPLAAVTPVHEKPLFVPVSRVGDPAAYLVYLTWHPVDDVTMPCFTEQVHLKREQAVDWKEKVK